MSATPVHPHKHDENECGRVLTHLNDYIDHKLSPELCEELEAHLAQCENCRVVFDTLNKTLYLVHQLREQPAELPETVEYRLFAVMNLKQFFPKKK
jgi:predicted anti-sigma-YlaC factor YlaD